MYIFERNEDPGLAVQRVMREQVETILQCMEGVRRDPVTAVHESRKCIKRSRALLRLARKALGDDVYRHENYALRDVGRLLSDLRDRAVVLETLQTIFPQVPDVPAPEGVPELAEQLEEDRNAAYAELTGSGARAAEVISGLQPFLARLGESDWHVSEADLKSGLGSIFLRARKWFYEAASPPRIAGKYHEWRKQVKYLWYGHELMSTWYSRDSGFMERTARLDHLSDLLGLAHDAAVLGELLTGRSTGSIGPEVIRRVDYFRLDHEGAALFHGDVVFRIDR